MNGLLLFLGLIAVLGAALELTHRRSRRHHPLRWAPGRDTRSDRDAARLGDDLRAAGQREPETELQPSLGHLNARQMAYESRVITRAAA